MEQINVRRSEKLFDQIFRIAKALILKTSERTIEKAEAQKIFTQLAQETINNPGLTVEVLVNLSDLLLEELKVSGSDDAFNEVNYWTNKLLEFAKTQQSYSLLVETYLLQSQLALLELDIQKAQNLLFQVELLASEKKLGKYTQRITEEQESLQNNLSLWDKLLDQKAQ
ncbi:MAG: hypothetical protein ACFFDT_19985 [Candidatus Hodarchaeota archaeon]